MKIRCWGSRGSIPVSGKAHLVYGGDTTCIEIRTRSDDILIIDAGTGIRRLGNRLVREGKRRFHFLFTHAHWDHLMGLPFFKPLYIPETELSFNGCPFSSDFVGKMMQKLMGPPHFPVSYSELKAKIVYRNACPERFEIGSVTIDPIPLSHPGSGSGYRFTEAGKSFVFLTDNELGFAHDGGKGFRDYVEFCSGASLLFQDAEYTPGEYRTRGQWGHSSYTDALRLAMDAGVERLGLFHLNQDRTDRAMDRIVDACRRRLAARKTVIDCFAVACDATFNV